MLFTKRQLISTAAAAGSAAVLAPMRRASAALDKISVAVIPIADCAPIYLGKAKGFFAKQNLDVELSTQGGGAAIIPGVLSG
ncbi:MAG: ABC transporter substrate-binding protein, partial [Xanthobacteraceae bacterium]